MKNLVVGAGLTGAVIAERIASQMREEVVVIDRASHTGGMFYDYIDKETGILVQPLQMNYLHTNNKFIWDYVNGFSKLFEQYVFETVKVQDTECDYPLNLTLLHDVFPECLGKKMEEKLVSKYGFNKQVTIAEMCKNFDDDLKFLAEYIYENIYKPYTIKMWGIPETAVPDCANAYLPFNISYDSRSYKDKYQGYPIAGWSNLIDNLLKHKNIKVKLNTDISDINIDKYDRIFYTGSIDELFDYKFGELPYRSVKTRLESYDTCMSEVVSMISPRDFDFIRTFEYKHIMPISTPTCIVGYQYIENFELGKNERFYPINNSQSNEIYKKYREEAKSNPKLYFAGRLGEFKIADADELITRAFEIVAGLMLPNEDANDYVDENSETETDFAVSENDNE